MPKNPITPPPNKNRGSGKVDEPKRQHPVPRRPAKNPGPPESESEA